MNLLYGWLWVLASVIGNAEFWVILVNRSHALAVHHRRLKLMRACTTWLCRAGHCCCCG